jgi:cytochrome P450
VDLLAGLDPAHLRERAHARTAAVLATATDPVDVMSAIARPVPIRGLGAALGVQDDLTPAVAAAARSYQPHADADAAADSAVAALVAAFGGVADEPTAARIGLLVQACDATAGLIGNAISAGVRPLGGVTAVAAALAHDPPVRRTRRIRNGREIQLDLTTAPFGAGPHRCPGSEHATAIAAGVLDGLAGWHVVTVEMAHEPAPALRIPTRILMASHSITNP